jgi:hypothetical protein
MIEGSGSGRPKNVWIRIANIGEILNAFIGLKEMKKDSFLFSALSEKIRVKIWPWCCSIAHSFFDPF